MKSPRPHINEILTAFFAQQFAGKKGVTRTRLERVERVLHECMEAEGERVLVTSDLAVLAAEREFEPEGAFARTMHADDLIFVLTIFLEPQWLQPDPLDERVQLRTAEALTAHILRNRLVDRDGLECPLLDIRGGIDRAKGRLNRERRQKQRG